VHRSSENLGCLLFDGGVGEVSLRHLWAGVVVFLWVG